MRARRGQRQVEVECQRVVDDEHVELIQLGGEALDDLRAQRREFRRDLAAVEGFADGAHRRLAGVQLGDDGELRRVLLGQWTATSGEDCHRVAASRKAHRLLVEDGFDTTDDRRAGVVQEPDARPSGHGPAR